MILVECVNLKHSLKVTELFLDLSDEDTLEAHDQPSDLKNYSRMSVSINARSVNDATQASLEEVPWNEVSCLLSRT